MDALGRETGLRLRRRQITPWRLSVSLLSAFATRSLDSLADLQREYNALFDTAATHQPFHKQLAKAPFAEFMRSLSGQWLDQLRIQVL